jgi:hypothetical protein
MQALIRNHAKEAIMFRSRIRLGWVLAVIVVLAAALIPVAGATARGIQPTSPWYAFDAALRKAQHERQEQIIRDIQPTSPWYAYDAALRKAQHQRQEQKVG